MLEKGDKLNRPENEISLEDYLKSKYSREKITK